MRDDTTEYSETTRQVLDELDPGTVIEDRVILSRRQVVALSAGTLSLGALAGFGAGDAEAQAAGAVGTDTDPVDVQGYDVEAANSLIDASGTSHSGELADASDLPAVSSTSTADGYEITINGDTYQFNE